MYCVIFNGPPESGKDTLSEMLVEHMDSRIDTAVREESLSLPLRKLAYQMAGWTGEYEGDNYSDFKRAKFEQFGGATGRQLMIDVSERFLKLCYGEDIMAQMLIARNQNFRGLLLIRDGGFQLEVDPLIRAYGVENVYIVNIIRPGKDFTNDSREWINHPRSGSQIQISNDSDLFHLRTEAGRIYGRLVNQMGWVL